MEVISRQQAKALGLKRYFTGKPCKHGHIDERRVHDGACCECQRLAYREYADKEKDKERSRKRNYMVTFRESLSEEEREVFNKEHYLRYSDQYKIRAAVRQKRVAIATPPWVDLDEIKTIYAQRPEGYHVDHIVPIKGKDVCGLHVPWNLQYLEATENMRKSNKFQQHGSSETV